MPTANTAVVCYCIAKTQYFFNVNVTVTVPVLSDLITQVSIKCRENYSKNSSKNLGVSGFYSNVQTFFLATGFPLWGSVFACGLVATFYTAVVSICLVDKYLLVSQYTAGGMI